MVLPKKHVTRGEEDCQEKVVDDSYAIDGSGGRNPEFKKPFRGASI
jgi:hypothetical protein